MGSEIERKKEAAGGPGSHCVTLHKRLYKIIIEIENTTTLHYHCLDMLLSDLFDENILAPSLNDLITLRITYQ